jgi:probable HAF family extracellular repeat protein
MTRKLLHSLPILVLAFFVTQGRLLMAQSANGDGGTHDSQGLRDEPRQETAPVNPRATSSQIPLSSRDASARGMAKTKIYKFRSVDYPGVFSSDVYDFNGKTAVGCEDLQAFTFHGSSYLPLNVPGAGNSCAYGINIFGKIVGDYYVSPGPVHGFLYDGSRYTTIDYPGSSYTYAWDINDAGLIVGYYIDSNDVRHGFLYDNGTFTVINFPGADDTLSYGINSSGDIVGLYDNAQGTPGHGFLLSNGVYSSLDVPLAYATVAQGINDAGMIAGTYSDASLIPHGFKYAGGVFTTVDVPGAAWTELRRIKNSGNVVGVARDSVGEYHGIIGK